MTPREAAQKLCADALALLKSQEQGGTGDADEDLRLLRLCNVWLDVAKEIEHRYRVRAFPLPQSP